MTKVSVFYDHVREASRQTGKTEKEILGELYVEGARGLEIRLTDLLEDQGLYNRISDEGFEVSCIYEFYEMEKKDETAKGRKHIDVAAGTGCGRILVVPGFLGEGEAEEFHAIVDRGDEIALESYMERNHKLENMCRGLSRMTVWGKEKNVKVTVEDFDDQDSPLSRIGGIRWFLNKVPDLGFTFDMGNFAYMHEDIWKAWKILGHSAVHVHCKDRCRGLEPAAAGTGDIPIGELVEKLRETGYEGWLAAEHFGAADQEAFMLESVRFLIKECAE